MNWKASKSESSKHIFFLHNKNGKIFPTFLSIVYKKSILRPKKYEQKGIKDAIIVDIFHLFRNA